MKSKKGGSVIKSNKIKKYKIITNNEKNKIINLIQNEDKSKLKKFLEKMYNEKKIINSKDRREIIKKLLKKI